MSAISQYITQIQNAVYGEQVRGAIVSALEACYSDVENPDLQSAAFLEAIEEAYENGVLDITEVTQVSAMTNENIIYRYMGTQTGYTANTLYFHNGSAWVPIGSGVRTVNNSSLMTDTSAIYKYTGTETGMVQNALYYHDGTEWILLSNQHVQEEIDSLDTRVSNLENEGSGVFFQKTLSVYGDSLTEVNSHYSVGYYTWIKNILGFSSVANYGVSGYTTESVYNKINETTNETDVIALMCGVNDQTFNVPLGTSADTTTGTTYGNVYKICELIKTKYPTSIIFFITPHFQTKYSHSGGVTSYEISRAIIEVCTKFSIPVYDNYVFSGLCSSNLSTFTTDGCHWNNLGHEMVGKNVAKWIADSFCYVYPHSGGGGGDEEEWEGYTMSITGGHQGAVHLVQLIDTQELNVGDAVDCTITCHSATAELTTPSSQGSTPAYFGDTSGEVGNSAYSGQYGGCNTTVSHVGSTYVINSSFTVLANSLGTPYIKTINRLSYATPFSFVIDSVVVKANNTQIPVEKFGTFFTQETFTLTAPN